MSDKCAIWGTLAGVAQVPGRALVVRIDSPRAGGVYRIDRDEELALQYERDDSCKARLTTWLVNQRELADQCPLITRDDIEAARNGQNMSMLRRADRVLQFLGMPRGRKLTQGIALDPHPGGSPLTEKIQTYYELLAHSESTEWDNDLQFLLKYLEDTGLVWAFSHGRNHYTCRLEMPGFQRLDELRKAAPASDQVFVAMWYDDSTDAAWTKGIEPAIWAAGYKPVLVKEQHFTGPIVDQVISGIRRSRFVVVDYTHGKKGARGSVYYEAGYAYGRDLTVISTCRQDVIDDIHFDVRQNTHIGWEEGKEEELKTKLRDRITAIMGDGPLKGKDPKQ